MSLTVSPRAKGRSRDGLIPLSPCSRAFVPGRLHSTTRPGRLYMLQFFGAAHRRESNHVATRGCHGVLVLVFQPFLGVAAQAR
jgi:hypothetical protein